MQLKTKFILSIGLVICLFQSISFYHTSSFQKTLVVEHATRQAKMLFHQIRLTRQWIADHNGLFLVKGPGVETNPFLDEGEIQDASGNWLVKRNPAMVTRELSLYAAKEGMGQFNVTSLMPVNPLNAPDAFERRSLQKFAHSGEVEAVEIEKVGDSYRLRYMAPLEVEVQCLACHAEQGYRVGDIRGGMNVTIPMDWAFAEINNNNRMFLFIAAATVVIVSLLIFLLFNSLVSRPLRRLTSMMDAYPEQPLAPLPDNDHEDGDEIDILNREFHGLCNRLERSQHELDTTREQVFQNEKQAALGRLVAGIAHEINNPLGGMQNCVEIMRRDPQDTERNERYLALVSQGVERIKCTVQQLLNIGRKEPLAIKKGDVDAMIRDSIELCCMGHRNITRELDLQVGREVVTGMESLRQVIINLAGNAVQAIGRDQGIIRASSRLRDGRLEIVLSDNGPGIDEAILDQIFEPFFTTKEVGEGTGLGLSISHSLISRLGGSLSVANLPDGGASFHISVPIEDAE